MKELKDDMNEQIKQGIYMKSLKRRYNILNKIYIGSTSNITNRLRHQISTHKNHKSTCSSKLILENRNYNVSVLRKDKLTKQAAKQAEYV